MFEIDLFQLYRRALTLVCGLYAILQTARVASYWLAPEAPENRPEGFLRRYIVTRLFRARLSAFWPDLLQIVVLLPILGYLILSHAR